MVIDIVEILEHWYAGRPKLAVTESLGVDRKNHPQVRGSRRGGRLSPGRPAGVGGATSPSGIAPACSA